MGLRKRSGRLSLGQSVTEMALVLPIMLFLVYGVFELGRVVFIFSALNNATREAARFGAATGLSDGTPSFLNCAAIRRAARESAFLANLNDSDIQIAYDTPVSSTMTIFARCGETGLDPDDIRQGDRIVITVTRKVEPILPVLPTGGFSLHFATARTILKNIVIGPVECSDDLDNDGDGFVDWDGDGGTPDSGCSGPDDTTEAFCYGLSESIVPAEGGSVNTQPDPNCANRYIEQTLVNLTAFPTERYVFKRWSGSINTTANPTSLVMDGDKDVTAEFRLRTSDLRVTKDAPDTVYAEKPFTYKIRVTNLYTETAQDVVITDTLPAGIQLQNWTITAGDCPTATETQFICEVVELPAGDTVTLAIDVLAPVVNDSPETITNTATASAFEHDPALSNNIAAVMTEVRPRAELTAHSKEGPADPVYAASFYNYTVTVGNAGPSIATGVTILDELPDGVNFVSSESGCTATGNPPRTVTCEIGELGVGATTTVVFTVEAPRNGQDVFNEATVSGNEYEDNTGDNTASDETVVISRANLALDKTAPDSATRDVPFNYTLTVSNGGPSDALEVQIVDTLPEGVQYNSFSSTKAGATCSLSGNTVTCNMGTIVADEIYDVILDVTPTISEGTLANTATVSSDTDDPASGNDSDSTSTTVKTDVNLAIGKKDSADPVVEGDAFTYTIRVDNNGASTATGVQVVDALPDGIDFVSADPRAGWTCTATSPPDATVTCAPDDGLLPGGLGATIRINVTASEPGTFTNQVRVDAEEGAATAETQTTVEPNLDLSLSLTAPASANAGVPFDYTITVANSGPSDANSVVASSPLDTAVSFESAVVNAGDGWACTYDDANHRVVCTAVTMAAAAEATFTITVTPIAGAQEAITEGVVSAEESFYDTNPGNDAGSARTTLD